MSKKMELSKEKKEHMVSLIKHYFEKERGEELGDLAAMLVLDFFIEKLAPEFYNQGVFDAYKYMGDCVEDMLGIQKYSK